MNNRLYYGDNLEILRNREYFPDECVDLIYLDPPFNCNRNYNVLFKSESRFLADGAGIEMPPQHGTLQQAERWKAQDVSVDGESQREMFGGTSNPR